MEKTIKYIVGFAYLLMLVSFAMMKLHMPNFALPILLGILVVMLIGSPLFLIYLNRIQPNRKVRNFLLFLSFFLFAPMLFFAIQRIFFPFKIAVVLALVSGIHILVFVIVERFKNRLRLGMLSFPNTYILFLALMLLNVPIDLQVPDHSYRPTIKNPAYPKGEGTLIFFDEGHNNIHKLSDRFLATSQMLENDGYIVKPLREKISSQEVLNDCKILIICNALHDDNVKNWSLPIHSAFTETEISNIVNWVYHGGSLLLIVNHMPLPGAAYDLAKQFGFELKNGDAKQDPKADNFFYRANQTLGDNVITNGRYSAEAVDTILSFDGTGFLIPDDAVSILTFGPTFYQWEPQRVWDYRLVEPYPIEGYSQGAFKTFGEGRIVIYGEAMMFTAQLGAGLSWVKLGMNSPKAPHNHQLFLNTIHWLDRLFEE